jgi:type IV secretion system protein VirB5
MASAVSGSSLASGAIGGLASSFQQQNHIYLPTTNNPATTALTANANSIANLQATASTFYQSSVDHVTALQQLESELAGATDEKTVADIEARIQLEQAYLTAQQIQVLTLSMMQDAQKRNQAQRAEENRQLSISNALSTVIGN